MNEYLWVSNLWPCTLIPSPFSFPPHSQDTMIFNTLAMHSLILFLCKCCCFSLKYWLSHSPFQQLFLPQKLFLTTLVLVRHPFSVFPLPEHLPPTVSQLPVHLCVLLIKLHISWGQWTWPSHSYCFLSNSTVPGTNRHLFDEWTRKQKQWEYIRILINHIMNEEAEGSEWGGKKPGKKHIERIRGQLGETVKKNSLGSRCPKMKMPHLIQIRKTGKSVFIWCGKRYFLIPLPRKY